MGPILYPRGQKGELLNTPGLPPTGDPRTPDILVTPNIGVTYSSSSKKLAEHGGFAHDDVNVMMLPGGNDGNRSNGSEGART